MNLAAHPGIPGIPEVPARLREPASLVVQLAVSEDEALRRLQSAVERKTSLEHFGLGEEVVVGGAGTAARLFIPSPSDRRIVGSASSDAVNLAIEEAERPSRRKSWNMQFRGRVESSDGASFLRGVVEIRELRRLRWMLPALRALAVLPILFGLFPTARLDIENMEPLRVIATVALTIAIWLVLARMQEEGERAAADDARLLAAYLRSELAGSS